MEVGSVGVWAMIKQQMVFGIYLRSHPLIRRVGSTPASFFLVVIRTPNSAHTRRNTNKSYAFSTNFGQSYSYNEKLESQDFLNLCCTL